MQIIATARTHIFSRLKFWREAAWKPWSKLAMLAWTVLSESGFARDVIFVFLPESQQETLSALLVLPRLQWELYTVGIAAILSIAVLEGAYRKWDAERKEKEGLERELETEKNLTKPNFRLAVGQAPCFYIPSDNVTFWFPIITVINSGAPSAVVRWSVHYKSSTLDKAVKVVRILEETLQLDVPGNPPVIVRSEDTINRKSGTISKGDTLTGRLPVLIPGDRSGEIASKDALISVTALDYQENPYTASWVAAPAEKLEITPWEFGKRNGG